MSAWRRGTIVSFAGSCLVAWLAGPALPQRPAPEERAPRAPRSAPEPELSFPPALPGGKRVVTDTSDAFLKPPPGLSAEVAIARAAPTIDFAYYPGQDDAGAPWSAWGGSVVVGGRYYASIGDHRAPEGNAFVYEYDPAARRFRKLLDLRAVLNLPPGHYTPGKIHSRLDLGSDGWLYCSTHRGSPRVTTDAYHYGGDWIVRVHPVTGKAEAVAHAPIPRHALPAGLLDPKRLIFYAGTAPPVNEPAGAIQFLAFDLRAGKLICAAPHGPARALALAGSTGRVYFTPGEGPGPLMRFDPAHPEPPVELGGSCSIRAATNETPEGRIYTVSLGTRGSNARLAAIDTHTEHVDDLGRAAVGSQQYISVLEADASGRFVYYVPGAHGSSDADGSAVVQFDTRTHRKKVIAFLHPFYHQRYGCTPRGTYSLALDATGATLFITWNTSRGSRAWDCCAFSAIHIPESERAR